MNSKIIMPALVFALAAFSYAAPKKGTMTDPRDGQKYKTVKIGKQVWMAENLNYETTSFPNSCYWNNPANCEKRGRLYSWIAANLVACPNGWHLPTKEEFQKLIDTVGGKNKAGKMLKSKSGWKKGDNGADAFGFSALPAGVGYLGFYDYGGTQTYFWSSAPIVGGEGVALDLDGGTVGLADAMTELSVRCLKGKPPKEPEIDPVPQKETGAEVNEPPSNSSDGTEESVSTPSFGITSSTPMTDPRDDKTYKTVKIGEQVWMEENLNFEMEDSYCYDDKSKKCKKFGRLYTWESAVKACPTGWHLPKIREYKTLISNTGSPNDAGKFLKSISGWQEKGNGTREISFYALPAGGRTSSGDFHGIDSNAYFWSSTENAQNAYSLELYYDNNQVNLKKDSNKSDGLSVRCIKD